MASVLTPVYLRNGEFRVFRLARLSPSLTLEQVREISAGRPLQKSIYWNAASGIEETGTTGIFEDGIFGGGGDQVRRGPREAPSQAPGQRLKEMLRQLIQRELISAKHTSMKIAERTLEGRTHRRVMDGSVNLTPGGRNPCS